MFLTETTTRHALVVKHRHFQDRTQTKLQSNSTRLVGASSADPIDVDDNDNCNPNDRDDDDPTTRSPTFLGADDADAPPPVLREESDGEDAPIRLDDIPDYVPGGDGAAAAEDGSDDAAARSSRRRREPAKRAQRQQVAMSRDAVEIADSEFEDDEEDEVGDGDRAAMQDEGRGPATEPAKDDDDEDDDLFVRGEDDSDGDDMQSDSDSASLASDLPARPSKRLQRTRNPADDALRGDRDRGAADSGRNDDKKKLALTVTYEGFSIYGRVLCLVVRRRDPGTDTAGGTVAGIGLGATSSGTGGRGSKGKGRAASAGGSAGTGQAVMENWISSTQVPLGMEEDG